jgi:hypothetical protein
MHVPKGEFKTGGSTLMVGSSMLCLSGRGHGRNLIMCRKYVRKEDAIFRFQAARNVTSCHEQRVQDLMGILHLVPVVEFRMNKAHVVDKGQEEEIHPHVAGDIGILKDVERHSVELERAIELFGSKTPQSLLVIGQGHIVEQDSCHYAVVYLLIDGGRGENKVAIVKRERVVRRCGQVVGLRTTMGMIGRYTFHYGYTLHVCHLHGLEGIHEFCSLAHFLSGAVLSRFQELVEASQCPSEGLDSIVKVIMLCESDRLGVHIGDA